MTQYFPSPSPAEKKGSLVNIIAKMADLITEGPELSSLLT